MEEQEEMVCAYCGCNVGAVGMSDGYNDHWIDVCDGCGAVEPEMVKVSVNDHECFICKTNGDESGKAD